MAPCAAGVVTTKMQASGLRALFPDLELLVRPNGYLAADEPGVRGASREAGSADGELRLVHSGRSTPAGCPSASGFQPFRARRESDVCASPTMAL